LKKILFSALAVFLWSGILHGQSWRPSLQVTVKGAYSAPLSHQEFTDGISGFPGVQLELAYDINSQWGIYGNFSADFLSAKNSTTTSSTGTFEQTTSSQLSWYAGPRYYVNLPASPQLKIFVDAGVGMYSIKLGDQNFTTTNPSSTISATYTSVSQAGVNLGTGLNITVGTNLVINFGAKYHFIFKKSDATLTQTLSTGTSNAITANVPEHSYIQFAAGIGYRFGL